MNRRVLLLAGAAILIVGGYLLVRPARHVAAGLGVDQVLAGLPPGVTATHGQADYDPSSGALSIHNLVITTPSGEVFSLDDVEATGLNLAGLRQVFDSGSYPGGQPAWTDPRTLIGHLEITGDTVTVTKPQPVSFHADHFILDGFTGRPFALPPTPENLRKPAFWADAALAIGLKSETSDNITETLANQPPFTITHAEVTDVAGGKIGGEQILGIAGNFVGPKTKGSFGLKKIALTGLDFSKMLALLPALGTTVGDDGLPQTQRTQATMQLLGGIQLDGWEMSGFSLTASPGPVVTLDDLKSHRDRTADGSSSSQASIDGLAIGLGDSVIPPQSAALITAFGMNSVTLDAQAAAQYDVPTRRVTVSQDDVTLRDLGTLHFTMVLSGYDQEAISSGVPAEVQGAMMGLTLEHMMIGWDDAGLTNRVLSVVAAQQGTTTDTIRAQAAMPLAGLAMILPDQPDAADQISAFLANPKNITITLAPPAPVLLGSLAGIPMTQRAHALGLSIHAE